MLRKHMVWWSLVLCGCASRKDALPHWDFDPAEVVQGRRFGEPSPTRDEGEMPVVWASTEERAHDMFPELMPEALAWRFSKAGSLGKRLRDGRHAVVRCERLSPEPVLVQFTPVSSREDDAWARTKAAWSPRHRRAYRGPGWEQGCDGSVGVLLDEGWAREAWRAEEVSKAWPEARPWANGFPVFLPGEAWVAAVGVAMASLSAHGGDVGDAGLALLGEVAGCHTALIGAEWAWSSPQGHVSTQLRAMEEARARLERGLSDADPRRSLDGVIAISRGQELIPKDVFDATSARWVGTPIFTFPAPVATCENAISGCGRVGGHMMPVDPVAWGLACDREMRADETDRLDGEAKFAR